MYGILRVSFSMHPFSQHSFKICASEHAQLGLTNIILQNLIVSINKDSLMQPLAVVVAGTCVSGDT